MPLIWLPEDQAGEAVTGIIYETRQLRKERASEVLTGKFTKHL